jgi:hypothetical protein
MKYIALALCLFSQADLSLSAYCQTCDPGKYSVTIGVGILASNTCLSCDYGKYSSGCGETACEPCPAGTYAHISGVSSCALCSPGTYSIRTGVGRKCECTKCPLGTYSIAGSIQCSTCENLMSNSQETDATCSSLIGMYSFESATFAEDSSGAGNLGTLSAPLRLPQYRSGGPSGNGCADFSNGGYFVAAPITYGANSRLSICLWFKAGESNEFTERLIDFSNGWPDSNLVIIQEAS